MDIPQVAPIMNSMVMDMSRLIARSRMATPTGIDRFELQYALWVRNQPRGPGLFIETGWAGPAVIRQDRAHDLIADIGRRWNGPDLSPQQSVELDALRRALAGDGPWRPGGAAPDHSVPSRMETLVRRTKGVLRGAAAVASTVPPDTTLIHVSHARLDRQAAFGWLAGPLRRGIFYVHDLIPLTHPEYVRAGEPERHARRMETVLRYGKLVLCNSQMTAGTLDKMAQRRGLSQARIAVLPPGVDQAFQTPVPPTRPPGGRPYFVCVGTIEPRKNHALLLNLWRRLVERDGDAAPRLIFAGRRGWDNSDLFKRLDRAELLRDTVIEAPALSDVAVASLLAGASALLAPSFAEGYGMPIAEALSLGTPVIASDILPHREVARGAAVLLDPLDGRAWLAAIAAHAAKPRGGAGIRRAYWTWADHFNALERLLAATDVDGYRPPRARAVPHGPEAYTGRPMVPGAVRPPSRAS